MMTTTKSVADMRVVFIARIVADGMAAAERDYATDAEKREGAIAGFRDCLSPDPTRPVSPITLGHRLARARRHREAARALKDRYWYWRCFEAEIEWVCNVVSASPLLGEYDTIIAPTARGVLKAAELMKELFPELSQAVAKQSERV